MNNFESKIITAAIIVSIILIAAGIIYALIESWPIILTIVGIVIIAIIAYIIHTINN